jgi:small subunit ribosomal protein S4
VQELKRKERKMKRKHKGYSKPKRPFDKVRIDEEAQIVKEFGLKNKREIWKVEANINSIREKAKGLISSDPKEQQILFDKLKKIGIKVDSIADVLSLEKQDYLKRRLQTVLVAKRMATTMKSSRQLITHKKVLVNGRVVNSPSYVVPVELESKISLKPMKAKKKAEKNEEPKEEVEKPEKEIKVEEKKDE